MKVSKSESGKGGRDKVRFSLSVLTPVAPLGLKWFRCFYTPIAPLGLWGSDEGTAPLPYILCEVVS